MKQAVSVRFVEDNDNINILDSQISNMFNPLDEETKKIREIIKNRKKTPYSKSRSETFDKEETESITMNNSSLQPLQIDFDRSESKFNTSNEKAKNGIETNEFSRRMSDSLTRLINPNQ